MADTRPTKITLGRAISLCLFAIFAPAKLKAGQDADNAARNNYSGQSEPKHAAFIVCHAFWMSLCLVVASVAFGCFARWVSNVLFGSPSESVVRVSQALGAGFLLWGTLFVRGWDIGTWSAVTLTERVNQWIYRSLYCLGTAMIVWSLT